ncbi:hypothetical protein [Geodermatophilus sp. CPCC 206100]|uniref:hypothetical protein n=1 Tax=Geodermatophilus sp. CPCC 206100 TaxID=3020054 RepID=UPI003B00440E
MRRTMATVDGARPPVAVQSLAELGGTFVEPHPEPPPDALIRTADVVVNTGAAEDRPDTTGARYVDRALPDPAGRPLEEVRVRRDELDRRVRALLDDLPNRSDGAAGPVGATTGGRPPDGTRAS